MSSSFAQSLFPMEPVISRMHTMLFSPAAAPDLATIRGQEHVKRALEVAACGGHSLVLHGPAGAGKTLLATALAALLPPLEEKQHTPDNEGGGRERPFVLPPPTLSLQQVLGRGAGQEPSCLSLAHQGVLCLDRLDLFAPQMVPRIRTLLDHPLWQPVQLVVTMQACPCGWYGDPVRQCRCTTTGITRYQERLAVLTEHLPMMVQVPCLDLDRLLYPHMPESSEVVRARILAGDAFAQERQETRQNRELATTRAIQPSAELDGPGQKLFRAALQQLHLTPRAVHGLLQVARTIADLAACEQIQAHHLAEAIQYLPR